MTSYASIARTRSPCRSCSISRSARKAARTTARATSARARQASSRSACRGARSWSRPASGGLDWHAGGWSLDGELAVPLQIDGGTDAGNVAIELYYRGSIEIAVQTPSGRRSSWVAAGSTSTVLFDAEGTAAIDNASAGVRPNGLLDVGIDLQNGPTGRPAEGAWTIYLRGRATRWDAWLGTGELDGVARFTDQLVSDDHLSVPATATSAISVGASISRLDWNTIDGRDFTVPNAQPLFLGQGAFFSSAGPSTDGRFVPDLVAPGEYVVAAMSRDATPERCRSSLVPRQRDRPRHAVGRRRLARRLARHFAGRPHGDGRDRAPTSGRAHAHHHEPPRDLAHERVPHSRRGEAGRRSRVSASSTSRRAIDLLARRARHRPWTRRKLDRRLLARSLAARHRRDDDRHRHAARRRRHAARQRPERRDRAVGRRARGRGPRSRRTLRAHVHRARAARRDRRRHRDGRRCSARRTQPQVFFVPSRADIGGNFVAGGACAFGAASAGASHGNDGVCCRFRAGARVQQAARFLTQAAVVVRRYFRYTLGPHHESFVLVARARPLLRGFRLQQGHRRCVRGAPTSTARSTARASATSLRRTATAP